MPAVFLFEFVTGGGWLTLPTGPSPLSWRREGRAMLASLAEDFARAGYRVVATCDVRCEMPSELPVEWIAVRDEPEVLVAFERCAKATDFTLLVAPETDGLLARWVSRARALGASILACDSNVIELCGDKHATAEFLLARRIRAPRGQKVRHLEVARGVEFPAVLKPLDGAGSSDVRLIENPDDLRDALHAFDRTWRLEEHLAGLAASVSFLCGPSGIYPLPPLAQRLVDGDGPEPFAYLGGEGPLPRHLAERATRLAARAVSALDRPLGWLGIDLVLGATSQDDAVIEINPRLTTSYVGLRTLGASNLARAMAKVAAGESPELEFDRERRVRFTADGEIESRAGALAR